jgi:hypothetical protein
MAELAHDDVERRVAVRERLGVPLLEVDFDAGKRRVLARVLDQDRRKVEPAHLRPCARRRERDDAGAAADVEDRLSGANARVGDEARGGHRGHRLERHEEAPRLALNGLELSERIVCHDATSGKLTCHKAEGRACKP